MEPKDINRELRPKPIDLVAAKRAALEQLQGTAWKIDHRRIISGISGTPIDDQENYLYSDFRRISHFSIGDKAKADIEAYFPSYSYIGTTTQQENSWNNADHFLSSRLENINYPTVPGVVTKFDVFGIMFTMTIGTLQFTIRTTNPYLLSEHDYFRRTGNAETICTMIMRRTEPVDATHKHAFNQVSDQARNPKLARASFLREFTAGMQQLRLMGFKTAFGQPTDERRLKVYQSMGMETFKEGDKTYTQLNLEDWPRLQG